MIRFGMRHSTAVAFPSVGFVRHRLHPPANVARALLGHEWSCLTPPLLLCSAQLSLSYNRITNEGAELLAAALAVNCTLTRVCCVPCHAYCRSMRWLSVVAPLGMERSGGAQRLSTPSLSAQLDLYSNQIGDAGVEEFAKALVTNSTLKEVCRTARCVVIKMAHSDRA